MPGMLDTILNLGLNDETVEELAQATDNERFAWDSYRRFAQMFGNVAKGVPTEQIEDLIAEHKRDAGVKLDTELSTEQLQRLTADLKDLYDFPEDPLEQLAAAVRAVFDSWKGEPRGGLPPPARDPRQLGHGGERAADGVRQQGRQLVLGGGLLPRRDHRRPGALGRLPGQRPGRGRGVRCAHAARPVGDGHLDARAPTPS